MDLDKEQFLARYERLLRARNRVMIAALLPFFATLTWFLFLTDYPRRLVESWSAARAAVLLLWLCFAGIGVTELAIPILLRIVALVCPTCGRAPRHRWINRHLALRTVCDRCGTRIFEEDWA